MLLTVMYFLLALLILVLVHEYGHFQVARWCGVKVLRFSFGFGKVLFRWHDKKGTEYAWSLVPLGGYVKMLDESEGEVAAHEQHLAFNNKSLLARSAIVVAGPMCNFIFAFIALWLVQTIGIYSLAPMIAAVKPNSIAAQAGLTAQEELITFNGKEVNSWREFQYAMMPLVGSGETVSLTVKSLVDGRMRHLNLPLAQWALGGKHPDPIKSLGIEPFIPSIPAVVGEIVPNSPAAKGGLEVKDKLLSLNGEPVNEWMFVVDYVQTHPGKEVLVRVQRQHKILEIPLVIGTQQHRGAARGFIGVRSQKVDWPKHWLNVQRQDPLTALGTALQQTTELTGTTFRLIGRLISGKLGLSTISGPVGIAQGAGDSGRGGLTSYLFFLALISISLGALNLLPLPLLDGGHLLYYFLELLRGKPLPEGIKSFGVYIGLLLVVTLMVIAFSNDLSRLRS